MTPTPTVKGRSFNLSSFYYRYFALPSFVELAYFTRFIETELRHSAISWTYRKIVQKSSEKFSEDDDV
ncbi:hypothetical protein F6P92_00785 [Streptococcus suis]|nr:hypothetical protein [Streptococcus suis]MBS8077516.1 hypothetical protein [Streptococcus suis]RRN52875.1 hypothetical protein EI218_09060 [Streptococcus suis]